MRTAIDIDQNLLRRAMWASGLATKKAVVEEGLPLLVRLYRQKAVLALGGKIARHDDLGALQRGHPKLVK